MAKVLNNALRFLVLGIVKQFLQPSVIFVLNFIDMLIVKFFSNYKYQIASIYRPVMYSANVFLVHSYYVWFIYRFFV